MSKFIQTHFFHPFTFLLPTKQKEEKLKYFLSSLFHHFIIFYPSTFSLPTKQKREKIKSFLSSHFSTPPTKQTLKEIYIVDFWYEIFMKNY